MPAVGLMTSIGFGAAAAVLMGSTMLARDASNGRLGFLFSRPVSWPAIWGGKWLAALVLVVTSGLLAAIPWMTAFPLASIGGHHGDSWIRAMLDGPGAVRLFVVIVLVVGFVNFGATAFRSRSPWVALDLVLLLAAMWVTRRYVAPLWLFGIVGNNDSSLMLGLLPLALGLLLGSVTQVAIGRTDPRRAHGAMSLAFWAVVGLTLAVAAGYWLWARSATPAEVRVSAVTRDPAGRWIYVEGSGQHSGWYPNRFLIDTTTARHVAHLGLDEELRFAFGMLFSADGRFGALPGTAKDGASLELFDLREATPRVTQVALESSPPPTWRTTFALSPSAASVFVVHESGASLFELPSGRRMATTTIQPGWRPAAARYLAEGAARAWLVPSDERLSALHRQAEMRVVDLATDGTASGTTFPLVAAMAPGPGWRSVRPPCRRPAAPDVGCGAPPAGRGHGRAGREPRGGLRGQRHPGSLPRGRAHRGRGPRRRRRAALRARAPVGVRPGGDEARRTSSSRCPRGAWALAPRSLPGGSSCRASAARSCRRTPWWSTSRAEGSSTSSPGSGPRSASGACRPRFPPAGPCRASSTSATRRVA